MQIWPCSRACSREPRVCMLSDDSALVRELCASVARATLRLVQSNICMGRACAELELRVGGYSWRRRRLLYLLKVSAAYARTGDL